MANDQPQHTRDVLVSQREQAAEPNSIKPERFLGNQEKRLGKASGVTQFGVNSVSLDPGSVTSLRHWHQAEDEFVYVLEGEVVLIDENGEHVMRKGTFVGFPSGVANAHHFINRSEVSAKLFVVGSRRPGEETIHYPDDPLGPIEK